MRIFKALAFSFTLALATAGVANAVPIPEEAKINGFAVGVQAYTFNRFSAWEAVEKAAQAGAKVIEFYPGQRFSKEDRSGWSHNTPDSKIAAMKEHLKKNGVRAVNYGVVVIPNDEKAARKIFEFAKKLDLYAISTESTESVDVIEKLVKEYDVKVGFHNHNRNPRNANYKVWDAKYILNLVKDRDPRIGAAADVGHWATDNFKAVDNLRLLKGRIISLHISDRKVLGRYTGAVALGAGVIGIADVLTELKAQGFDGNLSIEHEGDWNNNVPHVKAGVEFVRNYGK